MPAAVDHSTRIGEIETILRNGARSITKDGVKVEYDFAALRSELRKLRLNDTTDRGRRPVVAKVRVA